MKAIVLIVRGLQAGALGCYGNSWLFTPSLDALAAKGIVFDWHFADNPDPVSARRVWRSGCYHFPSNPQARNLAALQGRGEQSGGPDLLAVLRQQGIHTCLILDNSRPSPAEFTTAWDVVERVSADADEMPLDAVLEAAGAALERLEHRDRWLLWIELATLLPPWNVPAEFQEAYFSEESDDDETESAEADQDEQTELHQPLTPLTEIPVGPIDPGDDHLYLSLQASYAAAVSYVDAGIGPLLQALDGLKGGDDLLLIVTTDAGQNLGEHGIVGMCRPWLHDELIHLPFLLRLPGAAEAGRRVAALTQAVDLAPTLAEWFQMPLVGAHGRSLLPLARGQSESIRPCAYVGLQVGESVEYALRTPEWVFLLPISPLSSSGYERETEKSEERKPQLYVKPDDRWEVNDVLQHHLELAEQLERTLRDFVAGPS